MTWVIPRRRRRPRGPTTPPSGARPRCRAGAPGRTGWRRPRCRGRRRTRTSTPAGGSKATLALSGRSLENSRNSLVKAAVPVPRRTPRPGAVRRSPGRATGRRGRCSRASEDGTTPQPRRAHAGHPPGGHPSYVVGASPRAAAARRAPGARGRRCGAAGCRGPGSAWRRGARSPSAGSCSPSCTRSVSPVSRSWSTRQWSSSCHHARIRVCSPNSAPTSLNRSASGSWRVPVGLDVPGPRRVPPRPAPAPAAGRRSRRCPRPAAGAARSARRPAAASRPRPRTSAGRGSRFRRYVGIRTG